MPRRKTGDANGGQKSPGPKKSAKVNKITMQAQRHISEINKNHHKITN